MKLHVSQELQCKIPDMKTSSLKKQKIGTFKQLRMKYTKTVAIFARLRFLSLTKTTLLIGDASTLSIGFEFIWINHM